MPSVTVREIATQAMDELNLAGVGQSPSPADAEFAAKKIGRILDNWNAERQAVYDDQILTFTFTPNLNPTTIGPTGTWVVDSRPVSIEAINVLIGEIRVPVRQRDLAWYLDLRAPEVTSSIPTSVAYSPDWPDGRLHFYPVPSAAQVVELLVRLVLPSEVTLNTVLALPPGYHDALVLTLAEDLAPAYGKALDPVIGRKGREARARIFNNNRVTPRLQNDLRGPSGGGIDYLTGGPFR